LNLVRATQGQAVGVRLSTLRYMLYGRITARMRAIPLPGAVTTFITMSERQDEIDWEVITHGISMSR
jgi:beta-glucanase (GH16 family)